MANYTYQAIKNGRERRGSIEADSREKAMIQLKADGFTIIDVKQGSMLNKEISFGKPHAKPRDYAVFCRQFNSLLRAGVSIVDALDMLADQTENKALQKATWNVHDNVQKGEGLANSMRKEDIFPPLLVNMIEAGEASGSIENSLARMATHFEKDAKIKGMVKKAMIYPIILLIVAVVVLVIMVVGVLPGFAETFEDMDAELPAVTVGLLNLSDSLIHYWYIYILTILAIVVAIWFFKRTETGKIFFSRLALKLPVFGKLNVKTAASRFSRTFSTMMSSGMPMVEAMEITAKTMTNMLFKKACEDTAMAIQQGQPLSAPLNKAKIFPPLIIHMVGIGEETGNLEEMLDNCANYYDEEVEQATQQVMAMLEPMIILVLAGIVILILASIYGPMFELYNNMGNL